MDKNLAVDKIKKLAVVAFLTLLIWAYAYLALEETVQRTGLLAIDTTPPQYMVTFIDRDGPVNLDLILKGSASRVAEFKKRWRLAPEDPDKENLDFYYDIVRENAADVGPHTIDVFEFLRQSEKLKDLGLTVVSCSPETIDIQVQHLVEKELVIQVRNIRGQTVPHETIDPALVRMHVLPDYEGPAIVTLTDQQIEQARRVAQKARPYILLGAGRIEAEMQVNITLPSVEETLKIRPFQPSRIGYLMSPTLQGRFDVQLINPDELRSSTSIKASDAAMDAYEKALFHIYILVRDEDLSADPQEGVTRAVIYNFPSEYIRSGEIMLNQDPRQARFRLVPLPEARPSGGP
ncbi:MAG: hypothetical protein JXA82_14880 [Sedimentisphaerales bacterium]|nr:hypothetical protein [Sedimentisphaerales bacterium]